MSIRRLKALAWLGVTAFAVYLPLPIANFLRHRAELATPVDIEYVEEVLNSVPTPEPIVRHRVSYATVTRTWMEMSWTGAVVETRTPAPPPPPPVVVVAARDLVSVLLLYVDTDSPDLSRVYVRYVDATLAATHPGHHALAPGDRLPSPHDGIRVAAIFADEVRFAFDDGREPEVLRPALLSTGAFFPGHSGDGAGGAWSSRKPFGPRRVDLEGNSSWVVPPEDGAYLAEHYPSVLAGIRTRERRDPRTGVVDGIEIREIDPDSIALKYGLKAGQVIKSINDHPVTSVQQAIRYANRNKDKVSVWTVVYEEQGKEYTRTFETE